MLGRIASAALVLSLVCGMSVSTAIAEISRIYVNADCGDDAWTGRYSQCSGPDGYKRTIQAALDSIADGGTIMVMSGTYSGDGNRDLDFSGKAVQLTGSGPEDCMIDCDATGADEHRAFHFHSGETESSVVRGFRITNGRHLKGGAVLCYNSSPKFINCAFEDNEATGDDTGGGAMYNENSSPTLEGCTFTDNEAYPSASYGGGITNERSSPTLRDCTFTGNQAWAGGGIYNTDNSNPALENCTFLNNQAVRGAGMGNSGSAPTLSRCAFTGNSASYYGGGMRNTAGSNPVLTHCIFTGNSGQSGGAMSNGSSGPAIINCLFSGNAAVSHGGAVANDSSTTMFINCTIYGNSGPSGGGVASYDYSEVTITNSILWDNTPNQIYNDDPACNEILFSCVRGGWEGTGNISGDPLFADADGPDNIPGTEDDDCSILAGSPCIDAGNNSAVPPTLLTDLAGLARFADDLSAPDIGSGTPPIVDMGAYENQGDIPEDGVIYVDDTATGANNGSSWANAFNYLQDALEVAESGDEIRVAQGTYRPDRGPGLTPGDRDASFVLVYGVAIKGGYAGLSGPDPNNRDIAGHLTVLSGDLAGNDIDVADPRDLLTESSRSDNSDHVLRLGPHQGVFPVLDGLTVTGGRSDYSGGALVVDEGDLVAIDCVFKDNSAEYNGGAMTAWNSHVMFERCSFIHNAAAKDGGAVFMDTCTCRNGYGAFIDCKLINNSAGQDGGAIRTGSMIEMVTSLINCLIVGNRAQGHGGALYNRQEGGACWLVNCTLSGNLANAAEPCGEWGYSSMSLASCILWPNEGQAICGGDLSIIYSNVEDGPPDNGNIDADPLFVSPGHLDPDGLWIDGDYRLLPGSPCINAGDPDFVAMPSGITIPGGGYYAWGSGTSEHVAFSSDKDLDQNPRVVGGRVDMGAYEHFPSSLVAHWKLDETGGPVAYDSVGDNHGDLHGDPEWLPDGGALDGALAFDGQGDYVNCGDGPEFDITGQITVAAWVNISAVNMDWQTVIAKGDSAWRLSTAEDEYRYHFAVTGGPPWNYINGDIVVAANEWHHVCGTYDGADLRLYIDGAEDPASPVPEAAGVTTDEYDVLIGENQERPGRYWDGMIDDVRIYNYALGSIEVAQLFAPTVIYVDAGAPGLNNGCCWADAFNCLQDALALAVYGSEIRVAQGTYTPDCGQGITTGDRTATFQLKNNVKIKGGYAGYGHPSPDTCNTETCETILSGDLLGNDLEVTDPCHLPDEPTRAENSNHVVTASGTNHTAILDGVTITGGYATYGKGGGMYNSAGNPTLHDCTFAGNFAENGGAMFNSDNSNPLLTNCNFTENAAYSEEGGDAGAMQNHESSPVLINCTFIRNWVSVQIPDHGGGDGGGIANYRSSPILTGCTFTENTALCGGGAILNGYQSTPTITNCTFTGNAALGGGDRWANGGAMYNDHGDPIVTNCTFVANTGRDGGAVHNMKAEPVFTNCIFSGNAARESGGAVYSVYLSDVTLVNCTFVGNRAPDGSALACYAFRPEHFNNLQVTNCIIWDGENSIWKSDDSTITVTYSNVQNGWPGLGNIDIDPRFADAGYWNDDDSWVDGDYHLKSFGWRWNVVRKEWTFDRVTSRCIDAGNPGSPLVDEPLIVPDDPDNDYSENIRINMGAYGGTAEASLPPLDWALLADINNDGIVDFYDLACAGSYWHLTAPEQPCDLDRSGDAGPPDLDLFADDWLKTTLWWE
ncbi:MAG: right-handed parallel beta-helix repeat-containing protein [Phycisphaerae bacterium]|nr:right-handed parallel beta-helix repeat-containing protein [Phycisphaerae bacterium]